MFISSRICVLLVCKYDNSPGGIGSVSADVACDHYRVQTANELLVYFLYCSSDTASDVAARFS